MSQELARAPVTPTLEGEVVTAFAGDAIWGKNRGIYLGVRANSPLRHGAFLLNGQEWRDHVGPAGLIKSSWEREDRRNTYAGNRHIVTIGPNGSGKTRKLLLPNLFRLRDWSCVVIDPKGELCAHTAVWRAAQPGHRVVVIDPFGVMKRAPYEALYKKHEALLTSHGFNPLGGLDPTNPDSFVDDTRKIALALVGENKGERDPYWRNSARALIDGLILGLKIKFRDKADLTMLRQVIASAPDKLTKNFVVPTLDQFGKDWPVLKGSLAEFTRYSADDRELNGVRRMARSETNWLDSPPMQKDLQGGWFDPLSLKTTPTTIYLVLPPSELEDKSCWLRLMITSLLMPLLRASGEGPVPVLFMLDEAAALGHLEVIKKNYAVMRGYGIKFWTVWQGLTQAQNIYGDWWESLIGNAGILQTFAPQDLTTRDYLSKLSGTRQRVYQTQTTSMNQNYNDGGGYSFTQGGGFSVNIGGGSSSGTSLGQHFTMEPTIKPHELATLDADETVIFHSSGQMFLSVCPQPEYVEGAANALAAAKAAIAGAR